MNRMGPTLYRLTATVSKLFGDGTEDPNALEIVKAYRMAYPKDRVTIEGVLQQLIPIRNKLRDVPPCPYPMIHLVSSTYYEEFRDTPPTNRTDARRCLPVGYGKRSWGVRIPMDIDDPIWLASIRQNYATSSGKAGINLERLALALNDGMISETQLQGVLQSAVDRGQVSFDQVKEILDKHGQRISLPIIDGTAGT